LISQEYALKIVLGAGLTNEDFERMQENAWKILDRMG